MLPKFDTGFLFASLFWGSIGVGYWVYGRKQTSPSALVGGMLMIGVSYFTGSVLLMSALCLGIMAAVYSLVKRGN